MLMESCTIFGKVKPRISATIGTEEPPTQPVGAGDRNPNMEVTTDA